jgi:uncharacterized protein YbaR (Trm112 family)
MNCPYCRNNIEWVWIFSKAMQKGCLNGKKIERYTDGEFGETEEIRCSQCNRSLKNYVFDIGDGI